MKKSIQILAAVAIFFAMTNIFYAANTSELKKAEIKSSAFTFEQKLKIEQLIWEREGIKEASYDMKTKTLSVKYDESLITSDMILYDITMNLGFSAELKSDIYLNNTVKKETNKNDENKIDIDKNTKSKMQNEMHQQMINAEESFYQDYLSH
jgi:hypothetical protein